MLKLFNYLFFSGFVMATFTTYAQNSLSPLKDATLSADIEYRPRTEYRKGYRELPKKGGKAAFFTSHRARINVDFKASNFLVHTTLQDIRVWGNTDTRDANGKAQFYEFYVEPTLYKNWSVRVGRQRIKYDNQRLFAENNWRQAGGQHDAIRFIYKKGKFNSDIIGGFNQQKTSLENIDFPIDWDFYRAMVANFNHYTISKKLAITTINFADEYTDPATKDKKGYWKYTHGGRVTYNINRLLFNFAGYYQWGNIENGKTHNAYYLEPEVKWNATSNYSVRFGTQIFSGDKNNNDDKSTSFLAQYGAFHRHNGGLDYTQKTVRTNEHEGVLNPYIIQDAKVNDKFSINLQSHLLGTTTKSKKIYAWENDIRLFYKANNYTKIELAHLFLIPHKNITELKTGENGDTDKFANFTYVSINWTPKILNIHN